MADMFIYASHTETYGRVLREAMAAKLPVVALNAPSVTGLLRDKINGRIVYKKTLAAYTNTVKELLADKKSRETYAAVGKKYAIAEHDSAVSGKKLMEVYRAGLTTNRNISGTL